MTTHIVILYYKRPQNLDQQLNNLNQQTQKNLHVHILNNGSTDLIPKTSSSAYHFQLSIVKRNNQHKCMERYFYVRDHLLTVRPSPSSSPLYVIFLDDDQLLPSPHWIKDLVIQAKPFHMLTWYGKTFTKNSDYWIPALTSSPTLIPRYRLISLDYGGPGGSLVCTSIFRPDSPLWNIPSDLKEKCYIMDDLWLCHNLNKENFQIQLAQLDPIVTINDIEPRIALFRQLIRNKRAFFKELQVLQVLQQS